MVTSIEPRTRAWAYVIGQLALLLVIVLLPAQGAWPLPRWLSAAAWVAVGVGLLVVVAAALDLGPALTPTPEPRPGSALHRTGMYRFARHPIYSGLMLAAAGLALLGQSWWKALAYVALVALLNSKARFEETLLAAAHPDYTEYARTVPRFVPRLR